MLVLVLMYMVCQLKWNVDKRVLQPAQVWRSVGVPGGYRKLSFMLFTFFSSQTEMADRMFSITFYEPYLEAEAGCNGPWSAAGGARG